MIGEDCVIGNSGPKSWDPSKAGTLSSCLLQVLFSIEQSLPPQGNTRIRGSIEPGELVAANLSDRTHSTSDFDSKHCAERNNLWCLLCYFIRCSDVFAQTIQSHWTVERRERRKEGKSVESNFPLVVSQGISERKVTNLRPILRVCDAGRPITGFYTRRGHVTHTTLGGEVCACAAKMFTRALWIMPHYARASTCFDAIGVHDLAYS